MRSRRAFGAALVAVAAMAASAAAQAEDWPARSVLVVSPFAAGSANDTVARIVLDQVGQQIGEPFVIENRPGGGGIVGVASVVRAEPDGYTLVMSSASMSSAVILHKSLPYNELSDLVPIAMIGVQPSVLVAAPQRGFKTVADLVAAAKAKPGTLDFASAGIGSASHIAGERFRLAAGLDVQHIPYRGPVEALADLMTGRIDFYFVPLAPALSLINQGKVAALAVSTPRRAPALPDVPTIVEAGYPNADYLFWGGLSAPVKTPRSIVDKLNGEVGKALALPAMQEKLQRLGVQPESMSQPEFATFFQNDVAAMIKLGAAAHIAPTD
ncbi:MAG: tripartite tricarboxylate transporter substrate-binding protein [Xanthobacteraceae bacterium]|jgi:tripartite-type tricarboxylate transporter receptor subunit TctC